MNQLVPVLLLLAAIAVLLSYLLFPGEVVRTAAGAFSRRFLVANRIALCWL